MARSNRRITSAVAVGAIACLLAVAALPAVDAACNNPAGNPADNNKDDKVEKWTSACNTDGNDQCPACSLWSKTAKPGQAYGKYVYSSTATNGKKQASTYRAKILPTAAVQGIESVVTKTNDGATWFLWETALTDAKKGNMKFTGVANIPLKHPIAWINSLNARTQHQMHVHVGETYNKNMTVYNCIAGENWTTSPPAIGTWKTAKTTGACKQLAAVANDKDFSVQATSAKSAGINDAIRVGFKNLGSVDITKDNKKLRTGVLVQPHSKNAGEYLVLLITGHRINDYTIFGDSPP